MKKPHPSKPRFQYIHKNKIAEYRVNIFEKQALVRQYDFLFSDGIKNGINQVIDSWKDAKSNFICTACIAEVASENDKITLMGYLIKVQLVDFYINVIETSNQLIIGYDNFLDYDKDRRENKIIRFKCK